MTDTAVQDDSPDTSGLSPMEAVEIHTRRKLSREGMSEPEIEAFVAAHRGLLLEHAAGVDAERRRVKAQAATQAADKAADAERRRLGVFRYPKMESEPARRAVEPPAATSKTLTYEKSPELRR